MTDRVHANAIDRDSVRKAKNFIKEVKKLLSRNRKRVSQEDTEKLETAIQAIQVILDEGAPNAKQLSVAVKDLDTQVDQILGFARKSTVREYAESIFIAILIAVVLRAFVVEAFKIPTGSMIPTLAVGDHIFVNKFIYGLRVPLTEDLWFARWGVPERGDVIVFKYPKDLDKDYIKRVVAVSGDRVRVHGRDVYVNGRKLERQPAEEYRYVDEGEEDGFFADGPNHFLQALAYPESSMEDEHTYTVIDLRDRIGSRGVSAG